MFFYYQNEITKHLWEVFLTEKAEFSKLNYFNVDELVTINDDLLL